MSDKKLRWNRVFGLCSFPQHACSSLLPFSLPAAGALAQSAKRATVPTRHLYQVKALITSACLKHSDVTRLDNWIETSPTAVHMKPFFMIERVRHLGSTDSCPTEDAK